MVPRDVVVARRLRGGAPVVRARDSEWSHLSRIEDGPPRVDLRVLAVRTVCTRVVQVLVYRADRIFR